ncbi:YbaK/EbsC family protein [Enterococcus faecium]|uniref:YbaK/EbsC family protein n=1 Tax=Enterococcus faecium TaxID=1352 RepID=UPI00111DD833|nr:YbaK/EbsC family protein [Enterococcus faecium]TNX46058.1 prolyl-tRNA editing protein [Enterococcus faecium]HAZ1069915.1 prolyl-tRNA editing protein [Enterococcus faecium]
MIDLAKKFLHENIYFELYHHRAIYTNEDALVIKKEQGFTGTETKSLFLKDKKDNNYVYLTFTTKQTGQKQGAVSPFGYEKQIPIIIDEELLSNEKLVFAPGRPDQTMVIQTVDLNKIIQLLEMPIFLMPANEKNN